jgi:hypothetical protein
MECWNAGMLGYKIGPPQADYFLISSIDIKIDLIPLNAEL